MLCLLPQCVCVSLWSVGVNTCVGVAHWWQHLLATLPRAYFASFFRLVFFNFPQAAAPVELPLSTKARAELRLAA